MRTSEGLGLAWIAAYGAVTLGALAMAAVRRGPTLAKGQSLLSITVPFAAASAVSTAATAGAVPLTLALFLVAALAAAWVVRSRWLILRATPDAVSVALERCLTMLCAPFERVAGAYTVPLSGSALRVTVRSAFGRAVVVNFDGATRHKKAALLRALLAKQFDGVVPRLRIRPRG